MKATPLGAAMAIRHRLNGVGRRGVAAIKATPVGVAHDPKLRLLLGELLAAIKAAPVDVAKSKPIVPVRTSL
jgi:hypothetical protein